MITKIQKRLAVTSALAFGLLAACSDDNSSVQAPAAGDLGGIESSDSFLGICLADGYTGFYAADGATIMCLDASGSLAFWINPDGTIGSPESENKPGNSDGDEPSIATSSESLPASSSAGNTGSTDTPADPTSSSAIEQSGCDASSATKLYSLAGIDYYRDAATTATFYFNDNCEKVFLTEIVASSSSEEPVAKSSSSRNRPESSSSNTVDPTSSAIAPTSSSVAVSNGSEPSIAFSNSGATVTNDNGCVTVEGSNVTITCGGNYFFSGSNSNGQIKVLASSQDNVYLFMNSLTLGNTTTAPVVSLNSNKTFIVANEGTSTFTDASSRNSVINFTNASGAADTTYAGSCIFSKDDLTIKGTGTIKVTGNYNNGIHSSDDLRVRDNPTITVTAKNNAFKGKDLVDIEGGTLNLTATSGDGIKSDECTVNGKDTTITEGKGIVNIKGGTINIEKAGDDGIQAFNYVFINDSVSAPKITVKSTGKGIVSQDRIYINAGNIDVTSTDDGIHSNLNVYLNGGNITVSSGDDGIHADSALHLAGSTVNVTKASEGMEAFYIFAEGGITATYGTDDGWNAAGGSADGSTSTSQGGWNMGGGMGGGMQSSSKGYIVISGGYHYVSASGNDIDVLDANGTAKQSGGVVIVEIPASSGGMGGGSRPGQGGSSSGGCSTNMAGGLIDTDNGFTITGGVFLGFGSQTEEYPNCTATSYTAGTAYGSASAAFAPKGSGSMILYGGSVTSVAQVNTSGMQTVEFPNGLKYYYK